MRENKITLGLKPVFILYLYQTLWGSKQYKGKVSERMQLHYLWVKDLTLDFTKYILLLIKQTHLPNNYKLLSTHQQRKWKNKKA